MNENQQLTEAEIMTTLGTLKKLMEMSSEELEQYQEFIQIIAFGCEIITLKQSVKGARELDILGIRQNNDGLETSGTNNNIISQEQEDDNGLSKLKKVFPELVFHE